MILTEDTSPLPSALPLAAFKEHLRLGRGFGETALQETILESFLRAAIAAIEARTGKVLLQRRFAWTLTHWRHPSRQVLPAAPVSSIVSMTLVDRAGGTTPVPAGAYALQKDLHSPTLCAGGASLPPIPRHGQAVLVFVAGFGATWGDVPIDLQQAVMLLAAHYYEYREDTALKSGCVPFGVSVLIERYRPLRLHMGEA
ncbi:MAG: hypothetical protein GDA40_02570 [Rhodobacteraceae bacterium]|nr:hypothetical protein [Paracoccaceae bacterium]